MPGINGITKGRYNYSAIYRAGLTKLRNNVAKKMSSKVIKKGLLLEQYDAIEIKILFQNHILKIGSHSVSNGWGYSLKDKYYYIENQEYLESEIFRNALLHYSEMGKIEVIAIDDLKPDMYSI